MEHRLQQKHTIDILFLLVLFSMFTITSMLVVLIGANTYRKTVSSMEGNYEYRTLVSYLNEKIRQNDAAGTISVETLSGTCVLVLTQDYNGVPYSTCLYQYDGSIRESLLSSIDNFTVTGGQEVLSANSFDAHYLTPTLLQITITGTGNEVYDIYVAPGTSN